MPKFTIEEHESGFSLLEDGKRVAFLSECSEATANWIARDLHDNPILRHNHAKAASEIVRIDLHRDELLAALKSAVNVADGIQRLWDNDQDSKVGKRLLAMAGKLRGYSAEIDAVHAAIAKAEGVSSKGVSDD